jgi:hypothetical protein
VKCPLCPLNHCRVGPTFHCDFIFIFSIHSYSCRPPSPHRPWPPVHARPLAGFLRTLRASPCVRVGTRHLLPAQQRARGVHPCTLVVFGAVGAAMATQSSAGRRHTKRPRCGRARPWRWTPAQAVLTKMEHVLEVKLCGMGVGSSLAPGGGK